MFKCLRTVVAAFLVLTLPSASWADVVIKAPKQGEAVNFYTNPSGTLVNSYSLGANGSAVFGITGSASAATSMTLNAQVVYQDRGDNASSLTSPGYTFRMRKSTQSSWRLIADGAASNCGGAEIFCFLHFDGSTNVNAFNMSKTGAITLAPSGFTGTNNINGRILSVNADGSSTGQYVQLSLARGANNYNFLHYDDGTLGLRYNSNYLLSTTTAGAFTIGSSTGAGQRDHTIWMGDSNGGVLHQKTTAALASTAVNVHRFYDGTSSPKASIGVSYSSGTSGSGYLGFISSGSSTEYFLWHNGGTWYTSTTAPNIGSTSGTVVGTQTSDIRLKQSVRPNHYGLDVILNTPTFEFEMKNRPGVNRVGFVAQESMKTLPEAVYDAGGHYAMYYTEYVPVLVKAVQEQQKQIECLVEADTKEERRACVKR